MKRLIPFTFLLFALNCSGNQGKESATEETLTDSIVPETEVIAMLPDTVFSSASAIKYTIQYGDTTVSGTLDRIDDLYASAPGSMTFRNDPHRDANFGGKVDQRPTDIVIDWTYRTPFDTARTKFGTWGGGTGWTGQPLYVEWPDSCMKRLRANGAIKSDASNREIMFGSLGRKVYFLDYETGKPSRKAIPVDNPIKGTTSLDPTLNGNLYVGHGVPATTEMGALVIDLYKNQRTHFFGRDPKAQRGWGAYDSSPIRVGQFLFRPGENGTIYKYVVKPGTLVLHSALRYTAGGSAPGIESSMAVYRNYGYTADNAGNILCINLNTMRPVWRYKLPDDTDATPVVTEEADGVYLYVGNEVEHGGVTNAEFTKLNALTGEPVWKNATPAQKYTVGEKHFDGGFYATPLPGSGNCKHLIFTNVVANTRGQNGRFIAIDRATGKTVYSVDLRCYAWSSPVGFLDPDGREYIVTGDCGGRMYLFDGIDGTLITTKQVGSNFESSPVVIGSSMVVGSRGTDIFKLSLK